MIEHELLLLGLLKEGPQHGYYIKTKIKEILFLFAGVDAKSIYYPLGVLERRGLIARQPSHEGRRPLRITYSLTDKGERRFKELLKKSFLDFKRPQFSLDVSLYFLHYLDSVSVKRRLCTRQRVLLKISRGLDKMIDSLKPQSEVALRRILEHNRSMIEEERKFITRVIATT